MYVLVYQETLSVCFCRYLVCIEGSEAFDITQEYTYVCTYTLYLEISSSLWIVSRLRYFHKSGFSSAHIHAHTYTHTYFNHIGRIEYLHFKNIINFNLWSSSIARATVKWKALFWESWAVSAWVHFANAVKDCRKSNIILSHTYSRMCEVLLLKCLH